MLTPEENKRLSHYSYLVRNHSASMAATVARVLGEEAIAAKVLKWYYSEFAKDEFPDRRRAIEQRKYVKSAFVYRKVAVGDIMICAQAVGEGRFTKEVLAKLESRKCVKKATKAILKKKATKAIVKTKKTA